MDAIEALVSEDLGDGLALVQLSGVLTLRTAATIRAVLLKCLADLPDAVIVDVRRLVVSSRAALAVFPAVSRLHSPPSIPLILCGLDPPPWMLVHALNIVQHARVEDARFALAADRVAPRRHVAIRLPAVVEAPSRARALVHDACVSWQVEALSPAASIVVSELVSNAVEHAGTDLVVTLSLPHQYLHVAVRDGSRARPRQSAFDHYREPTAMQRGRGLHLVDGFATAWGVLPCADGKIVWATLRAVPLPTP